MSGVLKMNQMNEVMGGWSKRFLVMEKIAGECSRCTSGCTYIVCGGRQARETVVELNRLDEVR